MAPIYEYKCESCKANKEELKRSHADPPPNCCGKGMKKQISKGSFVLKGTGWYKDGYSGKG